MEEQLKQLEKEAKKRIDGVSSVAGLETVRVKYLGRRGELTLYLRSIHRLPEAKRRDAGLAANEVKSKLEEAFNNKKILLEKGLVEEKIADEWLDVTQPGIRRKIGHLHPVTELINEVSEIFSSMGYEITEGPEVEDDYHNFEALNMPKEHPARDAWDTFYLKNGLVMRTHTSPVQIRAMKKRKPPVRIIVPGRTYRYEAEDASHLSVFHQIEGFVVDKNITFSDLKGTLTSVMKKLLGNDINLRFRPSYFPFTEPSAEVDVTCVACRGKGCSLCSKSGWLELLGAGMIHPQVLRNVSYDPEKVSGFAFGMGVERIIMIKYGINDIREFFKGDLRFMEQF